MSVDGGDPRQLTKNPAADTHPAFSPDGRTLYALTQRRAGFESDRWYLDAHDVQTGSRRTVYTMPDLSVGDFTLSPDGSTIWFTAGQEARDSLFSVAATGGVPKRVLKGGSIRSVNVGAGHLVFSMSSLVAPAEVYRAAADGTGLTPLTRANEGWLKTVAFSQPESLTVNAAGGPVQYWLIKPPNFDPATRYPVVFLIHGGPQGVWGDAWSTRWNPSLWAAQGWVVVAPNPRGSHLTERPEKFHLTRAGRFTILNRMVKYSQAALDATFGALADPTRRAILARLAQGETSVSELAQPFRMSLAAVTKHLRVLDRAGLLEHHKDGRVRRCRLHPQPLKNAAEWIAFYQRFWEDQFDALEEFIADMQKEDPSWRPQPRPKPSSSHEPSPPRGKKSSKRG